MSSIRFLEAHISKDLETHHYRRERVTAAIVFPPDYKEEPQQMMVTLYRCSTESILTYCIPTADRKALQHVLSSAQRVIRSQLPVLEEVYTTRCLRKAISICEDPTHLCHYLFELLPSGRHYKALLSHTTGLKNSLYPRAVLKLYYGRSSVFTVSAFLSFTLWVSKYIYEWFLGTRHEAAAFSNCAIRFSSCNTCSHPLKGS